MLEIRLHVPQSLTTSQRKRLKASIAQAVHRNNRKIDPVVVAIGGEQMPSVFIREYIPGTASHLERLLREKFAAFLRKIQKEDTVTSMLVESGDFLSRHPYAKEPSPLSFYRFGRRT